MERMTPRQKPDGSSLVMGQPWPRFVLAVGVFDQGMLRAA
jgi:hypothetical protein